MPPHPPPPQSQPQPSSRAASATTTATISLRTNNIWRTEVDLTGADSPVLMIWSVDPPPPIRASAPPDSSLKVSMMSSLACVPIVTVKLGQQARNMSIRPGFMAYEREPNWEWRIREGDRWPSARNLVDDARICTCSRSFRFVDFYA